LAGQLKLKGSLVLDEGAVRVLKDFGRSLLSIGVTEANGQFERGDLVACVDPHGHEIARGLVNYSAEETRQIMRQPSSKIEGLLGYVNEPELIHRDNLVLFG
jgi:glutamate 5-kinase